MDHHHRLAFKDDGQGSWRAEIPIMGKMNIISISQELAETTEIAEDIWREVFCDISNPPHDGEENGRKFHYFTTNLKNGAKAAVECRAVSHSEITILVRPRHIPAEITKEKAGANKPAK